MKTALTRENDKFLAITLKHFSGLIALVNHPRPQKLCAIAHKMALKRENDKFSAMTLKPIPGQLAFGIALEAQNKAYSP